MNQKKSFFIAAFFALFSSLLFSACEVSNTTEAKDSSASLSVNMTGDTSITAAGTYTFSGAIDPITVDAGDDDDVEIILKNIEILSDTDAPIFVKNAKNVTITLAENSTNIVTDNRTSEEETEDFPNAAIFSMSDLKIKGESESLLKVIGNLNDGITSKDDLKIKNANLEVSAKDDAIRGKDSLTLDGTTVTIESGGDGLKSDNSEDTEKGIITIEDSKITIAAGDDGIDAVQKIELLSGNINISESYEGVEALHIIIHDGNLAITSDDDGINVAETSEENETDNFGRGGPGGGGETVIDGEVQILGGTITINSGGDGFDSNGSAVMTGGTLIVQGPTRDDNGPIDVNGTFDISGGTLIAIGSSGMAETPSETSSQYSFQVNFESAQPANTEISIRDSAGTELFSLTAEKQFQSITFSSPDFKSGDTISLFLNGEKYTDITLDGAVTVLGQRGGMRGGMGGMGGGTPPDGNTDPSQGMRTPPNMTLPENWEEMTEEEQRAYMESNRPQRPEMMENEQN